MRNVQVSALNKSPTPEIFYDGQWYPICGHYFWDGNTNAATTLCKQLGFASGTPTKTETKNSKNAMPVGRCNANEPLTACKGGGNAWGNLNYRGTYCHKGQAVGVTVKCTGGSNQLASSCGTCVKVLRLLKNLSPTRLIYSCSYVLKRTQAGFGLIR